MDIGALAGGAVSLSRKRMTSEDNLPEDRPLKRGWTTGACATAAARAAFRSLSGRETGGVSEITLPNGGRVTFVLAFEAVGSAAVIKDAGDDPDVTHGATVIAHVKPRRESGIGFAAGEGVGTVTRPGLPLAVGEPAINPVPRAMIRAALIEENAGIEPDVLVTISIPGGADIAKKTLNPRLGIVGGLSILGTTGIVVPFSCAAWIHSIHRGIDVARAAGLNHVAGATGATSEAAVQKLFDLPEHALLDMGDFAGGMLKYLKRNPVERVTIAGGPGKMTKLAQGLLDLHSRSGRVDLGFLAGCAKQAGADRALVTAIENANSALHGFELAAREGIALPNIVAGAARTAAQAALGPNGTIEIALFDRDGQLLARA
jgi:cobalt-precorrin-5B (C1)-methyltransferase